MEDQEKYVLQQVLEQIFVDVKKVLEDHGLKGYEIKRIEFKDQTGERGTICIFKKGGVASMGC